MIFSIFFHSFMCSVGKTWLEDIGQQHLKPIANSLDYLRSVHWKVPT
jgi:hypothetical protein